MTFTDKGEIKNRDLMASHKVFMLKSHKNVVLGIDLCLILIPHQSDQN